MAQILGPGESLAVGELRTDETLRFHLILQDDGNLVVYAHEIEPEVKRVAIGATHTHHLGANVRLHLNPGGWLEILETMPGPWLIPNMPPIDTKYELIRWDSRGPTPWIGPPGQLNLPIFWDKPTLHLQADGNLVLYTENFSMLWSIPEVNKRKEEICVIPGALYLPVLGDDGTFSNQGDKFLINTTLDTVGIRDALKNFVAVPPGGEIQFITLAGALTFACAWYEFPASGGSGSGSANAISKKVYGPGENVIRISGSRTAGFALA